MSQETPEMIAYREYAKKFAMRKPQPKAPNFANLTDWITKLTWPVVLSQILLVALRTAGGFYNAAAAEYPGVTWYPMAVAVCAFLGIELGVVIYAAHNARQGYNEAKENRRAGLFWVAIVFGATISIAAGLEQSSALVADVAPWLRESVRWFLVVTQGVFATIFAVIGGHLIGENMAHVALKREEYTEIYNEQMLEWREMLHKSWTSSAEYRATRGLATPGVKQPESMEDKVRGYLAGQHISADQVKPLQVAYALDITPSQAEAALQKIRS